MRSSFSLKKTFRNGAACLLILAQAPVSTGQTAGQDTTPTSASPQVAPPHGTPTPPGTTSTAGSDQENGSAVLYSTGSVQVNHTPVADVSLVFPGEIVQTDADGTARITLAGSTILLSPNTALTLQKGKPEMAFGVAQIATTSGLSLVIREITVSAAKPPSAKYDVSSKGDEIRITAHDEALKVTEGNCSQTVQPGTTLIINKSMRTDGKCTVGAKSPNTKAILGAAAAAGAVGVALAASGGGKSKQDPASPVHP